MLPYASFSLHLHAQGYRHCCSLCTALGTSQ